jgi:hypothetical protein
MVREDVEKGALVQLDMPEVKSGSVRQYAIYRIDTPPGPAGSWLIARSVARAAKAAQAVDQRPVPSASRNDQQARERQRRAG